MSDRMMFVTKRSLTL